MEFVKSKCPECNGILQVPSGLNKVICMYCGKEIEISETTTFDSEEHTMYVNICKNDFPKLLFMIEQPMSNFKKDKYGESFKKFYIVNEKVFDAIENAFLNLETNHDFLREISVVFVENAKEELEKIKNKKIRSEKLLDYNFIMATYIMPAILEYRGKSSEVLVDFLIEQWAVAFPKTHLGKATYEKIEEGFKWKLCYITTAVCESLGKGDRCYELNLLRDYRDNYLREQTDGVEIVKEYYDIAPTIVKRINKDTNASDIYKSIWKKYLLPCIRFIENGKNDDCKTMYIRMVRDLQKKFIK